MKLLRLLSIVSRRRWPETADAAPAIGVPPPKKKAPAGPARGDRPVRPNAVAAAPAGHQADCAGHRDYVAPMALHPQITTMLDFMAEAGVPRARRGGPRQARSGDPDRPERRPRSRARGPRPRRWRRARPARPPERQAAGCVYFHGGENGLGDLNSHDGMPLAGQPLRPRRAVDRRPVAAEHPVSAALDALPRRHQMRAGPRNSGVAADRSRPAGGRRFGGRHRPRSWPHAGVDRRFELLVYPRDRSSAAESLADTENTDGLRRHRVAMKWFAAHSARRLRGEVDRGRSPLLAAAGSTAAAADSSSLALTRCKTRVT